MELGFVKRKEVPRVAIRNPRGKENVCPDGKQGPVGSPLPEGYPRKPLQDITDVLASGNSKESDLDCGPSKKGKRVTLKVREQSKLGVEAKIDAAEKTICKGKSKSGRTSVLTIAEQVTLLVKSDLEHPVVAKVEEPDAAASSEATPVPPDGTVGSRQRKIHSPPALEVGEEASKSQRKRRKSRLESKPAPKAEAKVTSNIMKFR